MFKKIIVSSLATAIFASAVPLMAFAQTTASPQPSIQKQQDKNLKAQLLKIKSKQKATKAKIKKNKAQAKAAIKKAKNDRLVKKTKGKGGM